MSLSSMSLCLLSVFLSMLPPLHLHTLAILHSHYTVPSHPLSLLFFSRYWITPWLNPFPNKTSLSSLVGLSVLLPFLFFISTFSHSVLPLLTAVSDLLWYISSYVNQHQTLLFIHLYIPLSNHLIIIYPVSSHLAVHCSVHPICHSLTLLLNFVSN